jgi:hypothetical protein
MSNFTNKLFVMNEMDKKCFYQQDILFDPAEVSILGKGILRMIFYSYLSTLLRCSRGKIYIFNEVFGPKVNSALFQQELNPEFFLSDWLKTLALAVVSVSYCGYKFNMHCL